MEGKPVNAICNTVIIKTGAKYFTRMYLIFNWQHQKPFVILKTTFICALIKHLETHLCTVATRWPREGHKEGMDCNRKVHQDLRTFH